MRLKIFFDINFNLIRAEPDIAKLTRIHLYKTSHKASKTEHAYQKHSLQTKTCCCSAQYRKHTENKISRFKGVSTVRDCEWEKVGCLKTTSMKGRRTWLLGWSASTHSRSNLSLSLLWVARKTLNLVLDS